MVFGCVWEKGCVFERLRREEPRLALNDGCFGDEVEGPGSDDLEGFIVAIVIGCGVECAEEKGGERADPRGRLAGGGEEF